MNLKIKCTLKRHKFSSIYPLFAYRTHALWHTNHISAQPPVPIFSTVIFLPLLHLSTFAFPHHIAPSNCWGGKKVDGKKILSNTLAHSKMSKTLIQLIIHSKPHLIIKSGSWILVFNFVHRFCVSLFITAAQKSNSTILIMYNLYKSGEKKIVYFYCSPLPLMQLSTHSAHV